MIGIDDYGDDDGDVMTVVGFALNMVKKYRKKKIALIPCENGKHSRRRSNDFELFYSSNDRNNI